MSKLKVSLTSFMLPLVLLFGSPDTESRNPAINNPRGQTGTLQKMIVENGSVTMQFDLNGLNGSNSLVARPLMLRFAAAPNSFFPILVFNDLLRGLESGSMNLIPAAGVNAFSFSALPAELAASFKRLALEKLPSGQGFDLAVRDSNTGFTFFNIKGHQYNYDAGAQSLTITGGRLLLSNQFAKALGVPSDAGSWAGTISVGAAMRPIEITHLANGKAQSVVMPSLQHRFSPQTPNLVPGPDVIVGNIEDVDQMGNNATQVGLAIGTDSCNNGDQPVDWFTLPSNDHPIVPQNLYRMSAGADNTERFEQIGQSWVKHTFEALEESICGTCNTADCQTGTHLCPGCSDPYVASLNGDQDLIGSRAWINPFTGSFPSGPNNPPYTADDHSGHNHDGVSHRTLVEMDDLNTTLNPGASYFGEAAYISPHEYTWCQSHPTECNMFNNFSYRQFSVTGGPTFFSFSPVSATVQMQPAIQAWAATGATVNQIEPDPGNDGIFFVGYKVTGPTAGLWHYEYALFNMNLDRAIQSFQVVFPRGQPSLTNVGFHAPPQHPGWAQDGTFRDAGYSSTPWSNDYQFGNTSITWNCETFAQNQNANAIRWGTLYNFRFDSDAVPVFGTANIGFFKTGSPVSIQVLAPTPFGITATPTPRSTPSPRPRPTAAPRP